ncbi:hypothetical protein ACSSS7_004850 [Eimeria intestinalis]
MILPLLAQHIPPFFCHGERKGPPASSRRAPYNSSNSSSSKQQQQQQQQQQYQDSLLCSAPHFLQTA